MKKVILILVFAVAAFSCNKQAQTQSQSQSVVSGPQVPIVSPGVGDPCDDAALIATLTERVSWLEKENADLQIRLDECLGVKPKVKKSVVSKPRPVTKDLTKKVSAPAASPEVVELKSAPTTSVKKIKPSLTYLQEGGRIIFTVRVNGQENCYFPDYALQYNIIVSNAIDNNRGGKNFEVTPTEYYSGSNGVTDDGTFYLSHQLIKDALNRGMTPFNGQVEITTTFTGWGLRPMTRDGDFWIFRTQ